MGTHNHFISEMSVLPPTAAGIVAVLFIRKVYPGRPYERQSNSCAGGQDMNGCVARKCRKAIYGRKTHRARTYKRDPKMFAAVADAFRQKYQALKREVTARGSE
jgi:hypothetical protein